MAFGELYEQGSGRVQVHFVGEDETESSNQELSVYSVHDNVALKRPSLSAMAKKIKEIIELERLTQFYDTEEKAYKQVDYRHIAILDRWKKGSISEIIAALAAAGVPVSSESPLN